MPLTPGKKHLLFGLALLIATFVAYLPAIRSGFVWDDNSFLWDSPASPGGFLSIWFSTKLPDYFPLSSSMLWLEWKIFGIDNPWGYHAINVALHALSSLVLWRLLLRLGIPAAAFAALLFALHPVNVEAVAWIAQRKSTLSLLFALLATHLYFKGEKPAYRMALLCFLLALLAKTSVAMLPAALLILQYWRSGSLRRSEVVRTLPFFALAAALSLVTIWFQNNISIGDDIIREDGFFSRLALSGWAIWFYLSKALLPLGLSFVYPRWEPNLANPLTWLPLLLVGLALFGLWRRRARPWARAGFTAFAIYITMLFPVLGFFNIYFMRFSLVADHWQYPAIPAAIALFASLLAALAGRLNNKTLTSGLAAILLALFATLTWGLSENYKDEATLWRAAIEKNPRSPLLWFNCGQVLSQLGKHEEAIAHFRTCVQLDPAYADAHANLGSKLRITGKTEEAIVHSRRALELNPGLVPPHYNLGLILLAQGDLREARAHLEVAVQALNNHPVTLANLAWILAAAPEDELRDGARAMELASRAARLSPGDPEVLRSLAAALAATGRFEEAIDAARQGMLLASTGNNPALAARIRTDLQFYTKGLPLHDRP